MKLSESLRSWLQSGVHRIGQIEIQTTDLDDQFKLTHERDREQSLEMDYGGLEVHHGPAAAREIAMYGDDGSYRFAKGQMNLKRGWVMIVEGVEALLMALDQFYPASVGLQRARLDGTLEVQHLRDKLNRQTGMYRFARTISDAKAQKLIQELCGPNHQCARRILWQIDAETRLDDSEASRFNGILGDLPETEAIPLVCREACNHFVSECRRVAKEG